MWTGAVRSLFCRRRFRSGRHVEFRVCQRGRHRVRRTDRNHSNDKRDGSSDCDDCDADHRFSNNTYSSFNVSTAGASLDNSAANARLIVNQVTSTNPSVIQGDISVIGPRANVILANPNGITVNGGSFTNVGHMALATGLVDIPSTLSNAQPYVTLNTTKGTIIVGSSGMAGTLIGLELIAKTIQVNGPIVNQFSSSTAGVRLIGGASQISVDSGLSPTDNNNDWLSVARQTLANPNAIGCRLVR